MSLLLLFTGYRVSGGSAGRVSYDAEIEKLLNRRARNRQDKERLLAKQAADASEAAARLHDNLRRAAELAAQNKQIKAGPLRAGSQSLSNLVETSGALYLDREIAALKATIETINRKNAEKQLSVALAAIAEIERQLLDEEDAILALLLA